MWLCTNYRVMGVLLERTASLKYIFIHYLSIYLLKDLENQWLAPTPTFPTKVTIAIISHEWLLYILYCIFLFVCKWGYNSRAITRKNTSSFTQISKQSCKVVSLPSYKCYKLFMRPVPRKQDESSTF